jgi:hypothetical protein
MIANPKVENASIATAWASKIGRIAPSSCSPKEKKPGFSTFSFLQKQNKKEEE